MSIWNTYPASYRETEIQRILAAVRGGECVSIVGLSGAGKSNLLGFLANRVRWDGQFVPVDGNRLRDGDPDSFFRLILKALRGPAKPADPMEATEETITDRLKTNPAGLCLLLDRYDALAENVDPIVAGNLRALRDDHKYQLTFVTATRRPLEPDTELAELVFANTFWLGPLSESDTQWNVDHYAARKGLAWGEQPNSPTKLAMRSLSGGYPALLRAVSEAHSLGCPLEIDSLRQHPAVQRRVDEFWADTPTPEMISLSGLGGIPLLDSPSHLPIKTDTTRFTAKEKSLYDYFCTHPGEVCEKDSLILAVWPEDQIYDVGVRDDSLAQLVRRLRKKIEPDPSNPKLIQTVPGRGYLFRG